MPAITASKIFNAGTGETLTGIGTILEYDEKAPETKPPETEKPPVDSSDGYATPLYEAVSRNPKDYEGQKIEITGKVIQVSEGWFDSVTLRIDCDGDIWYVRYTHAKDESRILENDVITCYGECTGVETYTTVLGSKVTIPSMQMQRFDLIEGGEPEPAETEAKTVQYEITYNNIKIWQTSYGVLYQGIVEITNTGNTTLYLGSGKFDIETEDGTLIASNSSIDAYPQIIHPGEKAYYYNTRSIDKLDPSLTYRIVPRVVAEEATREQIYLATSDFRIEANEYGRLNAIGRIENTTGKEQSNLMIAVICFDSNGHPILLLNTLPDQMQPGEKFGQECSTTYQPTDITIDDVANFVVYVYPRQYQ